MKKFFAVPLAVLFVAACSESTTPGSDLDVSYAKPAPPPAGVTITNVITDDTYTFSGSDVTGSSGTSFSTSLEEDGFGSASGPTTTTSPSGQEFLGRFTNVDTEADLIVTNGSSLYQLSFDLYIIGSWDGKGKQAQNGVFLANVFSVGYECSGGATGTIFASTFSNQLTVQQDYPANIAAGQVGGNKAGTGSYAQDALNYRSAPTISNTPQFRSWGDTQYHVSLSGTNPCGAGQSVTFTFGSTAPNQQSNYDESWGIDNVVIRTGT